MAYGEDPRQYGVLGLPTGIRPVATVVMIHGGDWLPSSTVAGFLPMQKAVTALGYATWNLEYRGVSAGGGFPGTFEDIASGMDRLARIGSNISGYPNSVLTDKVFYLGQSAGAQLATWAASRTISTPGGPSAIRPSTVVSMGGPLNLALAARRRLAGNVVAQFMGGMPDEVPERYALGDPAQLVPASCTVWVMHGEQDNVVPVDEAFTYIRAARRAGGSAYFVPVPGSHTALAVPTGKSWRRLRTILARVTAG